MIDLLNETPITLLRATALPQLRRNGRKPHLASLHRWCSRGCRGIPLESIVVGGARCVTSESVDRWIDALTRQANGQTPHEYIHQRTPLRRQRDSQRASEELAAAGW
jgi:hypothetical protein